jgi:hypothetical protein
MLRTDANSVKRRPIRIEKPPAAVPGPLEKQISGQPLRNGISSNLLVQQARVE